MVVVTTVSLSVSELADKILDAQQPFINREEALRLALRARPSLRDGALAHMTPELSSTRPTLCPTKIRLASRNMPNNPPVLMGMTVSRVNSWIATDKQPAVQCTGVCMPDTYKNTHPLGHTHHLLGHTHRLVPARIDHTVPLGLPVTAQRMEPDGALGVTKKLRAETYPEKTKGYARREPTTIQTSMQRTMQVKSQHGYGGAWTSLGRDGGVRMGWSSMPTFQTRSIRRKRDRDDDGGPETPGKRGRDSLPETPGKRRPDDRVVTSQARARREKDRRESRLRREGDSLKIPITYRLRIGEFNNPKIIDAINDTPDTNMRLEAQPEATRLLQFLTIDKSIVMNEFIDRIYADIVIVVIDVPDLGDVAGRTRLDSLVPFMERNLQDKVYAFVLRDSRGKLEVVPDQNQQ